jgi:hypothetical protein
MALRKGGAGQQVRPVHVGLCQPNAFNVCMSSCSIMLLCCAKCM